MDFNEFQKISDPNYSQYYPLPDAAASVGNPQPSAQVQPAAPYMQPALPVQPAAQILPPVQNQLPAQPLPPGTYEYVSPMAAADEQYTQQQWDYRQQPSNAYQYPKRYARGARHGQRSPAVHVPHQPSEPAQVFAPQFYKEAETPTAPPTATPTLKRKSGTANFHQLNTNCCAGGFLKYFLVAGTYPPRLNTSLPPELTQLTQALFCALCNSKLNSSITAKVHYDSKVHERKVRNWLTEWATKTGNPIPERAAPSDSPVGPNAFHCTVCDVALTSQSHAQQHYMGKKHQQ